MKRFHLVALEDRVVPAGTGLSGQYFNSGSFNTSVLTRTDARIDFDWGTGTPAAGVSSDNFSVRWTGEVEPRFSETYTFTISADDGATLWVNDRLLVSRDRFSNSARSVQGSINLTAGVRVPIRLEYVERTGTAGIKLAWESPSQGREIVPTSQLYPGTALDDRGSLRQETWLGISTIADLTASANYPNQPSNRDALVNFESLIQNAGDGFARRVSGWVVPAISGSYTFAISGDDQAELWLSSDATEANASKMAFTSAPTAFRQWNLSPSQTSAPVNLVAGNRYFIRALHADANGTDHFSVGWQRPGDSAMSVIPGDVLIPLGFDSPQPTQANLLNTLSTAHPYLFTSPERFTRVQQLSVPGGPLEAWWNNLKARADGFLTATPNVYVLPDGVRLLTISRSVLDRVRTLALAFHVTSNTAYAERAWMELNAAAVFPNWNPSHFLDVAEMTHAFAIGYDWLYNYWSTARRQTIRDAIINHGLNPGLSQYNSNIWWARSTSNNWNFVCNGGMAAGALAIAADRPSLASDILQRAINSVRLMMPHFTTDNGGWYEGPGYWDYATDYLIHFLDGLETSLGSDFSMARVAGFSRTGLVPVQTVGPTKLSFNFADGGAGMLIGPQLFWLARRFNEPIYAAHERANTTSPEAMDLLRYDDRGLSAAALNTPLDEAFVGPTNSNSFKPMEVVALRSDWSSRATWVGFKGAGDIGDSHGHLDAGSFVLDANGVRWARDLGADDYSLPGYFSNPQRWTYYRNRAEGQNTLVLNPGSGADQVVDAAAPIILHSVEPNSDRSMSVVDLTNAYTGVSRVWRGVQLRNQRKEVIVQDEIVASTPVNGWWFMHVQMDPSQIVIAADGRSAVLTQGQERLYVKIVAGSGMLTLRDPVPLPTSPNPAGQNVNAGIKKLAVQLSNLMNERLAVWMVPLSLGQAIPTSDPPIVPLSDWGRTINDPPLSASFTTLEDTPIDIDLSTALSDPEKSRLSYSIAGGTNGSAVLQPDGKTVRFIPSPNISGPGSVQLNVRDEFPDSRLLFAYDFEPPAASVSSTIVDRSGNDREGTLASIGTGSGAMSTQVPLALAGRSTRSMEFTENNAGNAARINRAMTDFNFNTNNWTLSIWFRRRDTSNDDFVFYLGNSDGFGSQNELQLYAPAGSNTLVLAHYIGTATTDIVLTATNILPGEWYHVAVTVNTASAVTLYVNGTPIGTDTDYTLNMNTGIGAVIGGHALSTSATQRYFDGWLDDTALFSATLPAAEIVALSTGTVGSLGGSSTLVNVPITITPVNDPPTALPVTKVTWRSQPIDIDLRTLTADLETPVNQLLFAVTGANNGTAVLLPDGVTVRFTPAANYTGSATFTYTATDTWQPGSTLLMYQFESTNLGADGSGNNLDGTLGVVGTGSFSVDPSDPAVLGRFSSQSLRLTNPSDGNAARLVAPLSFNTYDFNTQDWSISGWFNRATSGSDDNVFYIGNSDGYGSNELWLTLPNGNSSARLQHDTGSGSTDISITRTGINVGTWNHFAVIRSGGTISFYVNGTLAGSDSSFILGMPANSSVIFGGHASTTFATSRWFDGRLDDLAIYRSALTAADVSQLASRDLTHAFGATRTLTANLTVIAPPTLTSIVANGGDSQRSTLTQLDLTFSAAFDASLLVPTLTTGSTVVNLTGNAGRIVISPSSGTSATYTLTFTNAGGVPTTSGVDRGSLTDGRWQLSIPALNNTSPAYHPALIRFFGDLTGDAVIDGNDFSLLGTRFGATSGNPNPLLPGFSTVFDLMPDNVIDGNDFSLLGTRFGFSI